MTRPLNRRDRRSAQPPVSDMSHSELTIPKVVARTPGRMA